MSLSKMMYELFERNFTVLSEKFEESIQQVSQVYNGLHLSHPFFEHPFFKLQHHEKEHLHSQGAKSEKALQRKNP